MMYKQLISVVTAVALGTSQVAAVAPRTHGEVEQWNGNEIRWHQTARDVVIGIPVDEWDDDVHQLSERELKPKHNGTVALTKRDLQLESRNLQNFCQATTDCYHETGVLKALACFSAAVEFLDSLKTGTQTIWDVANNKPVVTAITAGTVSIVIANQINLAISPAPQPAECSTSSDPKDALYSALAAAVAANPNANEIAVDVVGPTTFYTVTITAAPTGTSVNTPVPGQCTS